MLTVLRRHLLRDTACCFPVDIAGPAEADLESVSAWVPHADPHHGLLSIDTDVAVSASLGDAVAVPPTGLPIMARFEPLNLPKSQESQLSSVQLSPNRAQPDFEL